MWSGVLPVAGVHIPPCQDELLRCEELPLQMQWSVGCRVYRGTSLMRNCFPLGPYSRPYGGPRRVEDSYGRGTPVV